MAEGLKHRLLKQKAKEKLLAEGFRETEIFLEHHVVIEIPTIQKEKDYWIDVAGIKSDKKVAIECGIIDRKIKVPALKNAGWQVLEEPYNGPEVPSTDYYKPQSVGERKKYLTAVYNEEIYTKFKNNSVFSLIRYSAEDEDVLFGLKKHKDAWLNFPTKDTVNYAEWGNKIHVGLFCENIDCFKLFIGTDSTNAVNEFLSICEEDKQKLIDKYSKLPKDFFLSVGYAYKNNRHRAPPLPKIWESEIPVKDISPDVMEEIVEYLSSIKDSKELEIYPRVDILSINVKKEEIAIAFVKFLQFIPLLLSLRNTDKKNIEYIKNNFPDWKIDVDSLEESYLEILKKDWKLNQYSNQEFLRFVRKLRKIKNKEIDEYDDL